MKALIDTSFLMLCAEAGKDFIGLAEEKIGDRIECYVLKEVLEELEKISKHPGRRGAAARAALKLAKRMKILDLGFPEDLALDERLLKASKDLGMVLATIDLELIRRARSLKAPLLTVRKDQSIWLEGWIP